MDTLFASGKKSLKPSVVYMSTQLYELILRDTAALRTSTWEYFIVFLNINNWICLAWQNKFFQLLSAISLFKKLKLKLNFKAIDDVLQSKPWWYQLLFPSVVLWSNWYEKLSSTKIRFIQCQIAFKNSLLDQQELPSNCCSLTRGLVVVTL